MFAVYPVGQPFGDSKIMEFAGYNSWDEEGICRMKVVIIGGVATGPKVAARLRRLKPDAEITIVEQGEVVSYGACGFPLYLGNMVPQIDELMMTSAGLLRDPQFFLDQKDVKVLTRTKALVIDRPNKRVFLHNKVDGTESALEYDYLVLAAGAKPFCPPISGADLKNVFTFHHPYDAQALKLLIKEKKIKHVTVIGAGLIGIEAADALAGPRLKVTMCETQAQVLPKLLDPDMAKLLERRMKSRGIDLRLGCIVQAFEGDGEAESVSRVMTNQGAIETEAVIIAAGVRPTVELARETGLAIGVTGAIQVDGKMRTSDPFIYAGGDCAEQVHALTGQAVYIPLASTANKQGRVIADNIAGGNEVFGGVLGTSVLQAFDLNIGRTGLGEEEARQLGYTIITGVTSGLDSTHFYPMHSSITIKLTADPISGRILGGQVCGEGEGIKRLDVLTTALKYGATLEDIRNLDLGYAPPFATAIDVLIHAVNALENKRLGLVQGISASQAAAALHSGDNLIFVDVREDDEVESNPLKVPDVYPIPLGELRRRWQEIPSAAGVITVCELGIRGYEAACILQGKGVANVAYLEGGMSTWRYDFHNQ